ncbi:MULTISPECIES: hypothetical protein [unclassified Aliivibrio]|uniref:hypothetical protein n=1 Tax=unclassified Aliivibrio TaxID=2645654 RepID=UPI00159EDE30|nr:MULTISPECIES: hypothetical protein [unclassified Aliivibrio]
MFKIFPLIFICFGIYIGINYSDEVEAIIETDTFKSIQEKVETLFLDKIEEIKG